MNSLFLEQQVALKVVPRHIAIIMDGNRRWARQKNLPVAVGHWRGAEALSQIVEAAAELGVEVLTVYAFSTENWNRSLEEIHGLMDLFKRYLIRERNRMINEGVCFNAIGDLQNIPQDVQAVIEETRIATSKGQRINLIIAVNYGARNDICRATKALAAKCLSGQISLDQITEQLISQHLDTAPWGDPDLLIRTSGEKRLSNFLLWQISYAEVYITDVLWPDFNHEQLLLALQEFQKRERRIGG